MSPGGPQSLARCRAPAARAKQFGDSQLAAHERLGHPARSALVQRDLHVLQPGGQGSGAPQTPEQTIGGPGRTAHYHIAAGRKRAPMTYLPTSTWEGGKNARDHPATAFWQKGPPQKRRRAAGEPGGITL